MRRMLATCFIVIATVTATSSQANPGNRLVVLSQQQDATGGYFASLELTQTGFYIGEPSISLPAKAMPGATLAASRYAIRAWREGDNARIVVYAVVADARAPLGAFETPIATYSLAPGERVRVTETEQWGASPMGLGTMDRSALR